MDRDLIVEIIRKVFPPGTEISSDTQKGGHDGRFWVIPGSQGPRWILPDDARHGWPFLKQWRPYKLRSRIKWHALSAAYHVHQFRRVSNIVPLDISGYEGRTWDHMGWRGSEPPVPVIYIGTPGPARKAVVALVDPEVNSVAAIAKVPLGAESRRTIAHEAKILDRLHKEKPGLAPRRLFMDRNSGTTLQEAIGGKPTPRKLTRAHVKWLLDLAVPGETISLRMYTEDLAKRIRRFADSSREAHDILVCILSGTKAPSILPAVWTHGDFAPWNLKQKKDGTIIAVDWEYAFPKGLPLFDLLYFGSNQAFLFGEKKLVSTSMEPLLGRYLDCLGIDPGIFRALYLTCLAEDWLRCHKEGDFQRASFLFRHMHCETVNLG